MARPAPQRTGDDMSRVKELAVASAIIVAGFFAAAGILLRDGGAHRPSVPIARDVLLTGACALPPARPGFGVDTAAPTGQTWSR